MNRYEIFIKVVELGNLTKAAEVLHYTQAGVSHAIAALEREAGVQLLIRSNSGVSLTRSGEELLPLVQTLVNDQRNLAQRIQEINGVVAGTLRLGTFSSVTTHWLPRIIRSFQARYPKVNFELRVGNYGEITEQILSGKLDCGFLTTPFHESLRFVPLYRDPMYVLLPPEHPLARKPRLTLAEIKREPLILPVCGSDYDTLWVLQQDKSPYHAAYLLNDDISTVAMVRNGFGITIMPKLIFVDFCQGLAIRPLYPAQHRIIGIAAPDSGRASILTRTFLKFLIEEFDTMFPDYADRAE